MTKLNIHLYIGNKAKYEGDPLHAHGGSAWVK